MIMSPRLLALTLVTTALVLPGCAQLSEFSKKAGVSSSSETSSAENAKLSSAIASAAKDAQDSGMTRESLLLQEKLYHKDPNNQESILQYARALRTAGRIDDAKLVIRTPAKATRVTEPVLTEAAMVMISAGEYDEALTFAQKAVEKDSKSVDAHHALALALSGLGKYEDAQLQFQETIQMWPPTRDQTAVINNFAMALAAQGKINEARTAMALATGEALRSQTYQNNRALLETLKDRPSKEILKPVIPLPSDSKVSLDATPVKIEPAALIKSAPEVKETAKVTTISRATRKTRAASKAVSKKSVPEDVAVPQVAAPAVTKNKMTPIVD